MGLPGKIIHRPLLAGPSNVTVEQASPGMELLSFSALFWNDKQDNGPESTPYDKSNAQSYNPIVSHMIRVPRMIYFQAGDVHYELNGDNSITVYSGPSGTPGDDTWEPNPPPTANNFDPSYFDHQYFQ